MENELVLKKYGDARVAFEAQKNLEARAREELVRHEGLSAELQRNLNAAKALVDVALNATAFGSGATTAEAYSVHPAVPVTPPRTAEEQAHEAKAIERGKVLLTADNRETVKELDERIVGTPEHVHPLVSGRGKIK